MPQLEKAVIKERAARLRAVGAQQVASHLAAQAGQVHRILIESPDMGRTEAFTEAQFTSPQPVGQIVTTKITGHDGKRLTAA
jgi:threonylcarbamoyladenosine tRNA methylthiotransferase MtaB